MGTIYAILTAILSSPDVVDREGKGLAYKDKPRQARYPEQRAMIFLNMPED